LGKKEYRCYSIGLVHTGLPEAVLLTRLRPPRLLEKSLRRIPTLLPLARAVHSWPCPASPSREPRFQLARPRSELRLISLFKPETEARCAVWWRQLQLPSRSDVEAVAAATAASACTRPTCKLLASAGGSVGRRPEATLDERRRRPMERMNDRGRGDRDERAQYGLWRAERQPAGAASSTSCGRGRPPRRR